jgi:hypothetical protein
LFPQTVTPRVGSERSESVVEREREREEEREREREREKRGEIRVKAFRENREETKEMNYFPCV